MAKAVVLIIALVIAAPSWADDSGRIAALCKKQWSGHKGMQSFCIKEKRNYEGWLAYIRKRLHRQPQGLQALDQCISDHRPDYRRAFDCYLDD